MSYEAAVDLRAALAREQDLRNERDNALNEIERLRAGLAECAAPFRMGDENGLISQEELAREFNRRQTVATYALETR